MTTTTTRYETDRQGNFIVMPEQMDETLAAERRATVGRIVERLTIDGQPLAGVEEWVVEVIEEEAAR